MNFSAVQLYYLITPLFFILQINFDVNLRVAIPGNSESLVILYYVVCFFASFIVFKNIIVGYVFALIESSINVLLLLLSVMLPIFTLDVNHLESVSIKFGAAEILHFIIVGSVLVYSFYRNPLMGGRNKK